MPSIDYFGLVVLLLCMSFFVKGARMDLRSPWLWGGLSLGAWLVFTNCVVGGLLGGVLSQLLLLAGLTGWEMLRDRKRERETNGRG